MDEESSDVLLEVGSESDRVSKGARKKTKTTSATFHARHLILQDCAPALVEFCKSAKIMSPVQITDVKPCIFRQMLYCIYGWKVTHEELKANAKNLIDAADKYLVMNLKLEAEACYARSIILTVDNVLNNFLYTNF